jgi:hypothetical protein
MEKGREYWTPPAFFVPLRGIMLPSFETRRNRSSALEGMVQKRPGGTMATHECPVNIVCGFRLARPEPLGPVLYYVIIMEANPGIETKKTGFKPLGLIGFPPGGSDGLFFNPSEGQRPHLAETPSSGSLFSSEVGDRVPLGLLLNY